MFHLKSSHVPKSSRNPTLGNRMQKMLRSYPQRICILPQEIKHMLWDDKDKPGDFSCWREGNSSNIFRKQICSNAIRLICALWSSNSTFMNSHLCIQKIGAILKAKIKGMIIFWHSYIIECYNVIKIIFRNIFLMVSENICNIRPGV